MKRTVSFICVLALILSLSSFFSVSASAAYGRDFDKPTPVSCGISNDEIELRLLNAATAAANATIELYVRIAQLTPYNDVDRLLVKVDRVVAVLFAYADKLDVEGYAVECEYTTYYIDGQYVDIDPLRVIRI